MYRRTTTAKPGPYVPRHELVELVIRSVESGARVDRDGEDEGRLAIREGLHVPLQRLVPYPALQHLDEEPLLHVGVACVGARLDVLHRLRDEAREARADGDPVPTDVVRTDMEMKFHIRRLKKPPLESLSLTLPPQINRYL